MITSAVVLVGRVRDDSVDVEPGSVAVQHRTPPVLVDTDMAEGKRLAIDIDKVDRPLHGRVMDLAAVFHPLLPHPVALGRAAGHFPALVHRVQPPPPSPSMMPKSL
ncbi:hypothetical protein PG988_001596 [Apiospora saccharicola]